MGKYKLAGLWALAMTILDQATKLAVVAYLPHMGWEKIVPGFFNLVHVRNRGTSWGFLDRSDISWQIPALIIITIAALGFIGYLLKKTDEKDKWMISGLGLIGGGAIGNLIDRVRLGEVIDFLDFYVGKFHWPAFNIADAALTVGAGAVLVSMYIHRKNETDSV